ncbi:MAG: phenylacetic acid degradation protein PaaN, partial [Bacteroidetes bacterium SW_11_45_7]
KPVGKEDTVKLEKTYKPVPKGLSLVIGCATFPVWNSMPGLFGDLITGNTALFKPHPESVLPLALIIAEIQKAAKKHGYNPLIAELAADTQDHLLTKDLAEHDDVHVIDFTGSSQMGEYIESLINRGKTVFTEKAGINSVILDSMDDLKGSMQNLSFAVSLYSGQMCTAPQNFYIPENGIQAGGEHISYEDTVDALKEAISGLASHPKMGHNVLGAVHDEKTLERANNAESIGGRLIRKAEPIAHPDFPNARTCSPAIIEVDAKDRDKYEQELFGPVIVVVKTKSTEESVSIAKELSGRKGAITCAAYTTEDKKMDYIEQEMEEAFVPVTFNLLGPGPVAVNQNESFSDFHVSGGNPAGNASFTDPDFIVRRFRWIGHKRRVEK